MILSSDAPSGNGFILLRVVTWIVTIFEQSRFYAMVSAFCMGSPIVELCPANRTCRRNLPAAHIGGVRNRGVVCATRGTGFWSAGASLPPSKAEARLQHSKPSASAMVDASRGGRRYVPPCRQQAIPSMLTYVPRGRPHRPMPATDTLSVPLLTQSSIVYTHSRIPPASSKNGRRSLPPLRGRV